MRTDNTNSTNFIQEYFNKHSNMINGFDNELESILSKYPNRSIDTDNDNEYDTDTDSEYQQNWYTSIYESIN